MAGFDSWFGGNWFNLVQTAGIVGGLLMGAGAANREAKAREIENLLTIAEHHREVWGELLKSPEVKRVLQPDADVVAEPLTVREEECTNLVIVHYLKTWRIAQTGGLFTVKELSADVRGFFSLPLPRAFWEKTKSFRNPRFVRFVEKALKPRT
jgi:hypothetical protein